MLSGRQSKIRSRGLDDAVNGEPWLSSRSNTLIGNLEKINKAAT